MRASRSSHQFVHLLFPLTFLSSGIAPLFQVVDLTRIGGLLLRYAPLVLPIVGALFGGAALCPNPLGDVKEMLPVLVLSATDARQLITVRVITALIIGFPIGIVLPTALSVFGPHSAVAIVSIAVFGTLLTLVSGGVAVGLGALVPRYETTNSWGVEAVTPTIPATFSHVFGIGIFGLVGAILIPTSMTSTALFFGGSLLVLLGTAWGGFRYAVRQVRSYHVD